MFEPPIPAPYYYDDQRLTFDEPNFFWDGGFDLIALYGEVPRPRGGSRSSSTKTKVSYPEPDMIQIIFKTNIVNVNGISVGISNVSTHNFNKINNLSIKIRDFKIKPLDLKPHVSSSLYFTNKIKISSIVTKVNHD